jgi:hypothetical protein
MSAAELYIDFSTISQPKAFAMKGVGSINTTLNWPGGYNGACLKIGGANSFGIALEDFGINGGGWTSNSSGLVLQQVVGGNFIRIRTTLCGIGIQTLEGNPLGSNSMNCYFEACWTAFCKIGADIIEAYPMYFDTCNFNGMVGAGARSIRLRHSVTVILESCMFQGNNDECHIEQMGGYAQTVLRMQGFCYSEGTTPTFLKVTGPGGRYDFWIEGLYAQSFTTLVDCTPAGNTSTNIFIRIRDLYRDGNTILVKGLNQRNIVIDEADDPINTPSKWVGLDESSRASMVIHKSRNTGRAWSGQKSDDEELTSLLRPFAKDIFDPSIASLITLSGSDVTGMTGLLLGTAAAPASTPQRYVFVKDGDFGGNAYLHGTFAAATNMQGTWAAPYAAGEYGGVFYVARNVIATPGSGEEAVMPNLFVNGASPPAWVGGLGPTAGHVGIGAGVRSPPNPVTRANVGVVGAITYAVYAGHAADSPSVFVVQNICANSVQQPASWPVGNAPQSWPSGIIPSTLYDKFAFSSINPANGVDADLAYVAFLKLPLSRGVATKALQLAMQRFRLGLSALA